MKLLMMAMQTEHEGDSNGNHVTPTTGCTTATTTSTVCQTIPSPRRAAITPVQCWEHSAAQSQHAAWGTHVAPARGTALANNAVLWALSDVNSNPLEPARPDTAAGDGGTGAVDVRRWWCAGRQPGRDDGDSCRGLMDADRPAAVGHSGDSNATSCSLPQGLAAGMPACTAATRPAHRVTAWPVLPPEPVAQRTAGRRQHHQPSTDCRSPANASQRTDAKSSACVAARTWAEISNARNSAAMDTEDQSSALPLPASVSESWSAKPADVVASGERDPVSTHSHLPHGQGAVGTGNICSTPVLVAPPSVCPRTAGTAGSWEARHVPPPIWTALALRMAARSPEETVVPAAGRQRLDVTCPAACRMPLPSLAELDAVVKAMTRSASLSPQAVRRLGAGRRHHGRHRAAARHRSVSPVSPVTASPAKRSPRRAGARRTEQVWALGDVDVFLEALLEDECALYAGRLQAFFPQRDSPGDRKGLPDPVARILTEGDDMHFVPIRQEAGLLPAVEGSAFSHYIPT